MITLTFTPQEVDRLRRAVLVAREALNAMGRCTDRTEQAQMAYLQLQLKLEHAGEKKS